MQYNTKEMQYMSNRHFSKISNQVASMLTRKISVKALGGVLLLIATMFVLPILISNVDYVDDLARRISGYYGWSELGRFGMQFVMHILTFSASNMPNIGSFGQVLSIVPLSLAGYVAMVGAARSFGYEGKRIPVAFLFVGAVIVVNPTLVGNLAFRYDSFAMTLAYYISIHAAVLAAIRPDYKRVVLSGALIIFAAFIYQPMVLVFLSVATGLTLVKFLCTKSDEVEVKVLTRALSIPVITFISSVVIYFISMKLFTPLDSSGPRGELVPLDLGSINIIFYNISTAWQKYYLLFAPFGIRVILMVSLVALLIILGYSLKGNLKSGVVKAGYILIVLMIVFLTIMGPFALMVSNLTVQYRTLSSGVVVIFCLSLIGLYGIFTRNFIVRCAAMIVLFSTGSVLLYSVGYSYTFSSLLSAQRNYDMNSYSRVVSTLEEEIEDYATQVYRVGGYMGSPAEVLNTFNKRPSLELMEVAGDNSLWYVWTSLRNDHIGAAADWYTFKPDEEKLRGEYCLADKEPIAKGRGYAIYDMGNYYVIWFDGASATRGEFCTQ